MSLSYRMLSLVTLVFCCLPGCGDPQIVPVSRDTPTKAVAKVTAERSTVERDATTPSASGDAASDNDERQVQPKAISVTSTGVLRSKLGRQLTIKGRVKHASKSQSGHHFLNFADSQLTVICFKDDVGKFDGGGPASLYANKDIVVSGKLELYKGKLQIKLKTPTQIKLSGDTQTQTATHDNFAQVALKQTGEVSWESPAGLRYVGRDPQGHTRVEHVLRHAKDDPGRPVHGVFDGGAKTTFGIIDTAWKLAKKTQQLPQREGDRSTYLVEMGRRVGFLGGKSGDRRNNPPLNKVFIVFETGTKNIITAFPR